MTIQSDLHPVAAIIDEALTASRLREIIADAEGGGGRCSIPLVSGGGPFDEPNCDRARAHVDALIGLANLLPNDTDNGRRLIK